MFKKNEPKPIEEEGEEEEEDGSQIQNDNFLEGEVSSPFAKAASSSEEEIEPSKIAPEKQEKKQLDEAILKQSSSAQKKVIKRLFETESFGKAYK